MVVFGALNPAARVQEINAMFELVVAAVLSTPAIGPTGVFSVYPSFGGHPAGSGVEVIVDRGPISELVINCRPGSAIISYSKVERVFCTPSQGCHGTLGAAIEAVCGRD